MEAYSKQAHVFYDHDLIVNKASVARIVRTTSSVTNKKKIQKKTSLCNE
jgi:hypothetical protein